MSISISKIPRSEIVYPDSDGKPMADNTLQFRWIVTIKEGLEWVYRDRPDVFVAGDLFWYPVQGRPEICQAPDALVAFGRPKGDEAHTSSGTKAGIAPRSFSRSSHPTTGSRDGAKARVLRRYGVEEYYIYDPDEI